MDFYPPEVHIKLVGEEIPKGTGLTLCEMHNTDERLFFVLNFVLQVSYSGSVKEMHHLVYIPFSFCKPFKASKFLKPFYREGLTFFNNVCWLIIGYATHSTLDFIKWNHLIWFL